MQLVSCVQRHHHHHHHHHILFYLHCENPTMSRVYVSPTMAIRQNRVIRPFYSPPKTGVYIIQNRVHYTPSPFTLYFAGIRIPVYSIVMRKIRHSFLPKCA